jgi:Flp pilus assembly protein CpaB
LIIVLGLFLLVVVIGISVLLINQFKAKTAAAQEQAEAAKTQVVVITRDMKLGDRLEASDVSVSTMPVEFLPRDVIASADLAIGRYLKTDMVQGEMVLEHNLADPTNNNHDLSYILSEDHVLMAFPASDLMSRENIVQRGDVVDILATFKVTVTELDTTTSTTASTTGAEEQKQTVQRDFTVDAFQKVSVTALVLDVETDNEGNQTGNSTISSYLFALNPQDALVLKHLKDLDAQFDIAIRAPTSSIQFDLTPVTEEYLVELYGLEVLP